MTQLSGLALQVLRTLDRRGPFCYLNTPPRDPCLELVERGYCKLEPEYTRDPDKPCVPTGNVLLCLTGAGRHVLELLQEETVTADAASPHLDAKA